MLFKDLLYACMVYIYAYIAICTFTPEAEGIDINIYRPQTTSTRLK